MQNSNIPDCNNCKHYFVTWDAAFPKGCRKFNIKSRRIPCQVVMEADGKPCLHFQIKNDNT